MTMTMMMTMPMFAERVLHADGRERRADAGQPAAGHERAQHRRADDGRHLLRAVRHPHARQHGLPGACIEDSWSGY